MSGEMSETIFVVNQIGSGCYGFPSEPQIDKYGNWCGYGWFRLSESYMPPPGECWEYRLTRKGDIDTDGDPIGWKIVGIGKDGSVLCEKPNGQRRRYSFGDGAKDQPTGEAWERLAKELDELKAKLAAPEMPEVVKNYMDCTASAFKAWNKSGDLYDQWEKADADVRAYYAPPFVFAGEVGLYNVKMDTGAEIRCDVYQSRKGPMLDWYNGALISVNPDGTFPGGRITGRAGQCD